MLTAIICFDPIQIFGSSSRNILTTKYSLCNPNNSMANKNRMLVLLNANQMLNALAFVPNLPIFHLGHDDRLSTICHRVYLCRVYLLSSPCSNYSILDLCLPNHHAVLGRLYPIHPCPFGHLYLLPVVPSSYSVPSVMHSPAQWLRPWPKTTTTCRQSSFWKRKPVTLFDINWYFKVSM